MVTVAVRARLGASRCCCRPDARGGAGGPDRKMLAQLSRMRDTEGARRRPRATAACAPWVSVRHAAVCRSAADGAGASRLLLRRAARTSRRLGSLLPSRCHGYVPDTTSLPRALRVACRPPWRPARCTSGAARCVHAQTTQPRTANHAPALQLYFELHQGTFTSQAAVKAMNRVAEQRLQQAEAVAAVAHALALWQGVEGEACFEYPHDVRRLSRLGCRPSVTRG